MSVASRNLGHPVGFILQVLEGLESLLPGVEGCAETSLVFEHFTQGVRLDRGAANVIHLSAQVQCTHVSRNGLVILAHSHRGLSEVVDAIHDASGDVRFFAQLQCLLVIGMSIFVLCLFKINRSDVVQAGCLQTFISYFALDL